jgi:hypothetical protein
MPVAATRILLRKIPKKMVNANRETHSSLRWLAGTSAEFFMFPFT